MLSGADRNFQLSVPYDGFDESRAMAFALTEAIWLRYGMTVGEFIVKTVNGGYQISGTVEKADEIHPSDVTGEKSDDSGMPFTFGYRVKLSVGPASDAQ